MDFQSFLKQSAKDIDSELETFFTTWIKEIAQCSARLKPLAEALKESSSGGKRIRGTLVLLGYKLSNPSASLTEKESELLKIAVAYEIFQTAILAHDDIIDKSPMRRGKPSLYTALGGDHYGISQAVSLGDLGFFRAFKIIAESAFPEKEKNKALALFGHALHDTVVGEMLDVEIAQTAAVVSEDDILAVAKLKTAYYTFVGPLTLGAVLGGADDTSLKAIKSFGEYTGVVFQIQDDINDVFGTKESLKKEVGGDIREGKNTILIIKAREHANNEQFALLKKYYGNPGIGVEEIEKVKIVFIETGALAYAESLVQTFSEQASKSISKITNDKSLQHMLGEIIAFVAIK